MFSLLAKAMVMFVHEFSNTFGCLFRIKKTKEPRVRQQDMFAARGDVTQFRHREVRREGPIMFSK